MSMETPSLLRVFWPMGVVFGLIAMALIAVEKDRKLRFCMIGIAILWFIGSAATGSRTAVAFPLLAAALIIRHEISKRRLHLPMIAAALTLLVASVITFSVSLQARSIPHGLLNLPNVVGVTISDSLASTDSFLHPLKQLASSVFVSVPDAEQSATYDVGLDVLIANANVLPGTAQPTELERYWPYEWVPLSFAGTWFGATGWVASSCSSAPLAGCLDILPTIFSVSRYHPFICTNLHRRVDRCAFRPILVSHCLATCLHRYAF